MPRPKSKKRVKFDPTVTYFRPRGVPKMYLDVIEISFEEAEALRLKDVEGLDQSQAAKRMDTSQSTFQRILIGARQKVAKALIFGKAIKMIKPANNSSTK